MRKTLLLLAATVACTFSVQAQKTYTLASPDGRLQTTVAAGDALTYAVTFDGRTILDASPLSLTLDNGTTWGADPRVAGVTRTSADKTIASPFYRADSIRDHYNALTLRMKGDWSVEFRAYDNGVAYRFVSRAKKPFNIVSEQAEFRFPADLEATVPYVARGKEGDFDDQFYNSFENTYTTARLSELNPGRLMFLPLVVDAGDGVKVCITETDLENYPGLYLTNAGAAKNGLKGVFAPYPEKQEQGGHNRLQMLVRERKDHIAKVDTPRAFPWRMAIVGSDTDLAASNLSYLLAAPSRLDDIAWIKPGKVAWEWWNDWNLSGVDFRAGVNTETYKYYIDFAASEGIEYVILDEGWAVNKQADLMQVVPAIDLQEIVDYGRQKGVGIILWAGYWAFDRDLERVCKHYSEMGVKGFKVDFMDRDDQHPQTRGPEPHMAQRPELRGRARPRTDEMAAADGRPDEIRRDDPIHPSGRRPDGLHAGSDAERHKEELPSLQFGTDESGHALPPTGALCRAGFAAEHVVRLADRLPARKGVGGLHRRDPHRVGRDAHPRRTDGRIHPDGTPQGYDVVHRRHYRLDAPRRGGRPLVPRRSL